MRCAGRIPTGDFAPCCLFTIPFKPINNGVYEEFTIPNVRHLSLQWSSSRAGHASQSDWGYPVTGRIATARDICGMALSMQQLIDDHIGQPEATTAAQQVALRAMAGADRCGADAVR